MLLIDEHEHWLRRGENAKKLGVPQKVIKIFGDYEPGTARDEFLLYIIMNAPVMRVRGHIDHVTFEHAAESDEKPLRAIKTWGELNAGPTTFLHVVNLADGCSERWVKFEDL